MGKIFKEGNDFDVPDAARAGLGAPEVLGGARGGAVRRPRGRPEILAKGRRLQILHRPAAGSPFSGSCRSRPQAKLWGSNILESEFESAGDAAGSPGG